MYDDFTRDELVLPEFDDINDLQLFDSNFELDLSDDALDHLSGSFR